MNTHGFKFHRYDSAIRYHISRVLTEKGWVKDANNPSFTDEHLTLNDAVSEHFEFKHLLWLLIQDCAPPIMPQSYPLNDDNHGQVIAGVTLEHYLKDGQYQHSPEHLKWLLKPSTLNNGDHIYLFHSIEEVQKYYSQSKRLGGEHVLQRYISNPALIDGKKFTFRVFVIVTNFAGVYIYKDGYLNISSAEYDLQDNNADRKMHVTNYILDGELAKIEQRLASELPTFESLHDEMKRIVSLTITRLVKKFPKYLKPNQPAMELFGYDFMLDDEQKLWLLEINQGPDCPMIPDHCLNDSLWYPFWQQVVEEFVIPIASKTTNHRPSEQYFHQVLAQKQCYSRLRDWFS